MGCFHETCGFTNLPITYDTPVRIMAIRYKGPNRWTSLVDPLDAFEPVTVLAKGTYDDYGWVKFDDGEEEKFFESARANGLQLIKKENNHPVFPENVYQWMIREDVIHMINGLPTSTEEVSIGAETVKLRETFLQLRRAPNAFNATDEESMNRIDLEDRINSLTSGRRFNMGTYLSIRARRAEEGSDAALENFLDLQRVISGLSNIRRSLAPTSGSGSQDFNYNAYAIVGKFYEKAAKDYLEDFD